MEADSSDSQTKENRQGRVISNASNVLQSIWVRYNICSCTKNNGIFSSNRYYFLLHFNILVYLIFRSAKKI